MRWAIELSNREKKRWRGKSYTYLAYEESRVYGIILWYIVRVQCQYIHSRVLCDWIFLIYIYYISPLYVMRVRAILLCKRSQKVDGDLLLYCTDRISMHSIFINGFFTSTWRFFLYVDRLSITVILKCV